MSTGSKSTDKIGDVIEVADLLERVDGDRDLLLELARMFREDAPTLLANVRQAASARDAAALERAAHALKGSCSNFGAAAARDAAFALEQRGRSHHLERIDEHVEVVEYEIERLCDALLALEGTLSANGA